MESNLAILVLAGGQSKKLGEIKSLIEINDKPMIERVIKNVASVTDKIIISCKTPEKKLQEMFPDTKIQIDKFKEKAPIVGLISSLPSINREYVALVTCDSPMIKPEVIKLLFKEARGHSGAVPRWPNGHLEPLIAVYHAEELMEAAKSSWREGKMKTTKILDKLEDVVFAPTEEIKSLDSDLESFVNLNTPEDFKKIR